MSVADQLLSLAAGRIGINTHTGFNPVSASLAQVATGSLDPQLSGHRTALLS